MRASSRTFAAALSAAAFAASAAVAVPATAEVVGAVEYYHVGFEHYFVTSNAGEIAALDTGAGGWFRTGQSYRIESEAGVDRVPVCRFYSAAFGQKASHFFTASAAECEQVKANRDWTYEGVAFHASMPDALGQCAVGTAAVYRTYNNGRSEAPNHSYTPYPTKRDTLVAGGWVVEGVAFCVPLAPGDPVAQSTLLASSTWALPDIVYGDVIRTSFSASVVTDGRYDGLFGVAIAPPAVITHANAFGSWAGAAAWVPFSGKYFIVGASGFEYWPYVADAWELDSAQGPTSRVCSMLVKSNVDPRYPRSEHPFQPYLLTGCTAGVANKL